MPNKTKHSDAQKKLARLKLSPVAIQLLTGLLHDTWSDDNEKPLYDKTVKNLIVYFDSKPSIQKTYYKNSRILCKTHTHLKS